MRGKGGGCLLNEYFKTNDIEEYKLTADILLRGEYNKDLCRKYPELNDNLQQVLEFFRIKFSSSYSSLEECRQLFVKMTKGVRSMFPQVEQLLRLLLISPASSCEAERSFSALRRVKTWLKSTMSHERLNSVMMCHVH